MIVDLDPVATRGRARTVAGLAGLRLLMPLALGALAIGFGALVLRPAADPSDTSRARERVLAAVPTATAATEPIAVGRMLGPSVLAQRTPRPALPPMLTLSPELAVSVPLGTAEASRATMITVRDVSRQLVYRLGDGRTFVLLQTAPDRRRLVLGSYGYEEGTVRGQPAQFFTSYLGALRSMVSWTEGPAGYHLYSGSLTVRELLRMAEQLR